MFGDWAVVSLVVFWTVAGSVFVSVVDGIWCSVVNSSARDIEEREENARKPISILVNAWWAYCMGTNPPVMSCSDETTYRTTYPQMDRMIFSVVELKK
ncbi:MAG: hypothetical protein NPIRA02_31430 [Nitrospirales bacterium]|nr:MAG: hypothetical protein NPIRA02_31430 [Nitrospirales bacterium]